MSNKHNLVLYVDQELVEKSRELGFNLSKAFENHLKDLLTQFPHVNSSNNIGNNEGFKEVGPANQVVVVKLVESEQHSVRF